MNEDSKKAIHECSLRYFPARQEAEDSFRKRIKNALRHLLSGYAESIRLAEGKRSRFMVIDSKQAPDKSAADRDTEARASSATTLADERKRAFSSFTRANARANAKYRAAVNVAEDEYAADLKAIGAGS
jgi:hypothetical protein